MVREGYMVRPKPLTSEERERLKELIARVTANRERLRREHGTMDVAEILREARAQAADG